MTRAEALAEARRRWPRSFAHVEEYVRRGKPWYAVGFHRASIYTPTPQFKAMGRGASYEAAFAAADRRASEAQR